jgi:hypothetical protein
VVPPPVQPAPPAQAALRVYVEPDAAAGTVLQQRGREVFYRFREHLNVSLAAAGYRVLDTADTRPDLTIRIKADRIGFAYRPWAEGVVVEVTGDGRVLASASRQTLNWMSNEGSDTKTRLAYAAHSLVNALDKDPALAAFAANHGAAPAAPTPTPLAPPAAPPPPAAAPAAAPAASTAPPAATPPPAPAAITPAPPPPPAH